MRLFFIISVFIITSLFFISCSKKDKPDVLTFQFEKQATLLVKHNPNNNEHSIVGQYIPFLSPDYINGYKFSDTFNVDSTDDLILNYKISSPTETNLIVDRNLWLPVFLVPGDTLSISFNLSDSSKIIQSIRFEGKYASINEYKIRRYEKFRESFEDKCAELSRSNLSVMKLQNAIDSVATVELDFFNNYLEKNSLPNWYINYERDQIIYRAAFDKVVKIDSWKWAHIEEKIPNNYYNFINNIKINNEDAFISQYYYYFLWIYFNRFLPNDIYKMDVSERRKILGSEYLKISDSLLTGEIKEIFNTFIISHFIIDDGMFQLATENIEKQKLGKDNLKYADYLEGYLKDRSTLKTGAKAPAFYLVDTKNESKSLSDFKGSVLLLNFWFPGCTPCVQEIPFEQKLVSDFKNKNFYLINICFYSSKENWLKAINNLGMNGINLFANTNWQKKLIEGYKISGYPHYTLVDKNGNIVSNNPKRPSEGLTEYIIKLLNN